MGLIKYKILARHKWVNGCTITESISDDDRYRKFTATILGWRGFELYCGSVPTRDNSALVNQMTAKVLEIKTRIDSGNFTDLYKDCHI